MIIIIVVLAVLSIKLVWSVADFTYQSGEDHSVSAFLCCILITFITILTIVATVGTR